MDGNRLEEITPDGVYHCSLTLSEIGRNIIESTKWNIEWTRPIPSNGALLKKMVTECHVIGEEWIKRGVIPLSIHSVGIEEGYLTYTTCEFEGKPNFEYLLEIKYLPIGRGDYKIDWKVRPKIMDGDKVDKLVHEAFRTKELFRRNYRYNPDLVTASLMVGSRLVRSRAE